MTPEIGALWTVNVGIFHTVAIAKLPRYTMLLGALINSCVTSENATFDKLLSLALTIKLDHKGLHSTSLLICQEQSLRAFCLTY